MEEKRALELARDQGRAPPQRAEAPDTATSALTYSSNFWLFMEKHESANHFHSHGLYRSPQAATSPWGMTSGHQRAFNQTSREMKPMQADMTWPPGRGKFSVWQVEAGGLKSAMKRRLRAQLLPSLPILFSLLSPLSPHCLSPSLLSVFIFIFLKKLNGLTCRTLNHQGAPKRKPRNGRESPLLHL